MWGGDDATHGEGGTRGKGKRWYEAERSEADRSKADRSEAEEGIEPLTRGTRG